MDVELKSCPFCGCAMRFDSNRDWHKLQGSHEEHCVFDNDEPAIIVPAEGSAKSWAITAWNTRHGAGDADRSAELTTAWMAGVERERDRAARDAEDAARWRKLVTLPVVVECEALGWKYWHDEPRCKSLAERVDATISQNSTENPMTANASWHSGAEPPHAMTCDETGCTTGLALVVHAPEDGGPNVRQGRYDHCLRGFFDSATSQRIDPDQWAFAPQDAARAGERG